jgi:hypothetical protein
LPLSAEHRSASQAPRSQIIDAISVVLLLGIVLSVTYLYVSSESTFYTSDYGGYQAITQGLVARYQESLRAALAAVIRSTNDEYNAYFAVPLVPFLLLLGDSRLAFETALAVVYLVPFTLAVAAIAIELLPERPRLAFWSTATIVLLTPIAWVPTLRGYPDTGAAFLTCTAIWAYLWDVKLEHRWQLLVTGAAAAFAMLIRRHFVYDVLALFGAMIIHTAVRCFQARRDEHRSAAREFSRSIGRLTCIAAIALVVLLIVGRSFLYRGVTNNYIALYAAYMSAPGAVFRWFAATYGWTMLIASVGGFIVGLKTRTVDRGAALFIMLFGALSCLEWVFVVRQTGEQYTLHFTAPLVLGVAALFISVWPRLARRQRVLATAATFVFAMANMVSGLTRVEIVRESAVRNVLAMKESPLRRGDRTEMSRLISYLRTIAPNREPIYVAASSAVLSAGLLTDAERTLYGWSGAVLRVMYVPQIDSRDSFPLEQLLPAQLVVVAEPFQQHMGAHKQRVVKVVHDMFASRADMARDFEKLPVAFTLDNGTAVSVYKRIRPTSLPSALKAFRAMQRGIQIQPGGQLDWMALTNTFPFSLRRDNAMGYRISLPYDEHDSPTPSVLFVGPLASSISITGTFQVHDPCAPPTLTVATVNAAGESTVVVPTLTPRADTGGFAATFPRQDAVNVLLTFNARSDVPRTNCSIEVKDLRLLEHS